MATRSRRERMIKSITYDDTMYQLVPKKCTPEIEDAIKEIAPKWFAPSVWAGLLSAVS